MTMYLPNPDVGPVGFEPVEFIEPPVTIGTGLAGGTRPAPPTHPLDLQTSLNITRWAEEYISGLVANHHGDPEDVRAVIHRLHDQTAGLDDHGGL